MFDVENRINFGHAELSELPILDQSEINFMIMNYIFTLLRTAVHIL